MSSLSDAPSPAVSAAGPSRASSLAPSASAPTTRRASARHSLRVEQSQSQGQDLSDRSTRKTRAQRDRAHSSLSETVNEEEVDEAEEAEADADDASAPGSDMDADKVDEQVTVHVLASHDDSSAGGTLTGTGAGQKHGGLGGNAVASGSGITSRGSTSTSEGQLYPYMPHVAQQHSHSHAHTAQQPSISTPHTGPSWHPQQQAAPLQRTASSNPPAAGPSRPPSGAQVQSQAQAQTQTPQHQLAYMHHAPPPMARPGSVQSHMSLMANGPSGTQEEEEEDEGEFVPIDMGSSASASHVSMYLGAGPSSSIGRPEMQRAHTMGFLPSSPYPPPHAPGQGPSPYAHGHVQSTPLPVNGNTGHMLIPHPAQSPTDSMLFQAQQAQAHAHAQSQSQAQAQAQATGRRPGMPSRHSTMSAAVGPSNHAQARPGMQRQYSLQPPPARINSIGQDVFAAAPGSTPVRRVGTEGGMDYHYHQLALQGISPARALGPAPIKAYQYPLDDALTTPLPRGVSHIPSSVTSTSVSGSSSAGSDTRIRKRTITGEGSSDDEQDADSPTRPYRSNSTMHMAPTPASVSSSELSEEGEYMPKSPVPVKLLVKPPVVCRTSAKLARTADDPGVEGVPPGPRPMERPTPSFACIIGQAILASSAGGLSLEHIYRYVETAYPFFKTGDGAWRNSVRHNLSIHKMFGTIPRTEKFPPGKGGIWVIYEEEKIHWPSEGKFIKNFPASHPHHANCRQTQHERQKEQEAMAKAHAEGKEYVPRKGKKGRKLAAAAMAAAPGEGPGAEMGRTASEMSADERPMTGQGMMVPMSMPMPMPMQMPMSTMPHHQQQQPQHQQVQHHQFQSSPIPMQGTPMMMVPHGHPHPHPHAHAQHTPVPAHLHPHHAQMHAQHMHAQHQQQQHQQQQHHQMMPPPMPHHMQIQHPHHHAQNMLPGPLQPMIAQPTPEPHHVYAHAHGYPSMPARPRSAVQPQQQQQQQQQQPTPTPAPLQAPVRTSHEDEFRPILALPAPTPAPASVAASLNTTAPPAPVKRSRDTVQDEENVFTVPKRVRVNEPAPQPLASLSLGQQLPQHLLGQNMLQVGPNGVVELDDAYVTPERERGGAQKAALSSGAFKTPALVDSSSSPTSSPMPATNPRHGGAGAHNPSSLHQAWTNDDILTSASPAGSGFSLDAAFDIKPKVARKMEDDALWPPSLALVDEKKSSGATSPKAPPKTPLTRSSAAADRADRDRHQTPRHHRTPFGSSSAANSTFKTPMMFAGSPVLPRPIGHEMSTPAWELEGILDRLTEYKDHTYTKSPSRTGNTHVNGMTGHSLMPMRSPLASTSLTSTDPSRYASLLSSGDGSPKGKSRIAMLDSGIHTSPFRRRAGHGHVRGMGSLGSLSALSDIKGVLLPALREDRKREKAEVKRGDVDEKRVKDEDEEEVQEVEIGRGGAKVAKVEIGAA